jgi:hypothetical protein
MILVAFLTFVTFKAFAADCYSTGVRRGEIQKFSIKGVFNKSWEGEMVQDGIRTKSTSNGKAGVTNIWKFSVTDAAVAKKIEDAMFSGGEVAVKYCQSLFNTGIFTNTSYVVTDANVIK